LQPSGQAVLGQLGLLDAVIANAEPIEALHAWTHRHRTLVRLPYSKLDGAMSGYGVHRNDLFEVLRESAMKGGVIFQLGVTIQKSRQTRDDIFAIDDAGVEHGPFDALIAADGSRSKLREEPALRAAVSDFPLEAAWFSGKSDAVRGRLHQVTHGSRQLIGMLPLGQGRCSLFCGLRRNGREMLHAGGGLEALKREIVELCPQSQALVEQIRTPGDFTCTRYQIASLRQWNCGRLICIGDAAHATTPHLGQGVNLALLDALAVSNELDRSNDIASALASAADFRRAQVMWCWRLSNLLGPVFQNDGWLLAMGRDVALPLLPHLPVIVRAMVGTMAGLHTGVFARLSLGMP
jgi:2-polyprenyl-6-methoxyphenol hydroxylase-like FAD-dependent oxidoreductase